MTALSTFCFYIGFVSHFYNLPVTIIDQCQVTKAFDDGLRLGIKVYKSDGPEKYESFFSVLKDVAAKLNIIEVGDETSEKFKKLKDFYDIGMTVADAITKGQEAIKMIQKFKAKAYEACEDSSSKNCKMILE